MSGEAISMSEDNFVHYQTIINWKVDKRSGQVIHERGFTRPIGESISKKKKHVKNLDIDNKLETIEL